jgi:hypothetical protein
MISNNSKTNINWIKTKLEKLFEMSNLGLASRYLGLELKQGLREHFSIKKNSPQVY